MRKDVQTARAETGDAYWWSRRRRTRALGWIRNMASSRGSDPISVLDVGCGTGEFLRSLEGMAVWGGGGDLDAFALGLARRKGVLALAQSDAARLPWKNACVQVAAAFDVLEHTVDDSRTVCELSRVLVPGGLALITVPAHQWLWTQRDVMAEHYRRYTRKNLCGLLTRNGFEIEKCRYTDFFYVPAMLGVAMRERFSKSEPTLQMEADAFQYDRAAMSLPSWVNRILHGILWLEDWTLSPLGLPWGSSLFVVARKNGQAESV